MAGQRIRSVANVILRRLAPNGALPSGCQAEDLMEKLHDELWVALGKNTKQVKLSEHQYPVSVETPQGAEDGGGRGRPSAESTTTSREESTYKTVEVPRPEGWLWEHILVLVLYGNLAPEGKRHLPLAALEVTAGPKNYPFDSDGDGDGDNFGPDASSPSTWSLPSSNRSPLGSGAAGGVRSIGGVGQVAVVNSGRKKARTTLGRERESSRAPRGLQGRLVEEALLEDPPLDPVVVGAVIKYMEKEQKEFDRVEGAMVECMRRMVEAMEEEQEECKRERKREKKCKEWERAVDAKKMEVEVLSTLGGEYEEEALKVKLELLKLLRERNPVIGDKPATPATRGDGVAPSGGDEGPRQNKGVQSDESGGGRRTFGECRVVNSHAGSFCVGIGGKGPVKLEEEEEEEEEENNAFRLS